GGGGRGGVGRGGRGRPRTQSLGGAGRGGTGRIARESDGRGHRGNASGDHDAVPVTTTDQRPCSRRRPVVEDDACAQRRVFRKHRRGGVCDRLDRRGFGGVELPHVNQGEGPVRRRV